MFHGLKEINAFSLYDQNIWSHHSKQPCPEDHEIYVAHHNNKLNSLSDLYLGVKKIF